MRRTVPSSISCQLHLVDPLSAMTIMLSGREFKRSISTSFPVRRKRPDKSRKNRRTYAESPAKMNGSERRISRAAVFPRLAAPLPEAVPRPPVSPRARSFPVRWTVHRAGAAERPIRSRSGGARSDCHNTPPRGGASSVDRACRCAAPLPFAESCPRSYLMNSSSLYLGSVHIWSSMISSSLSMWRRISSKQTSTVSW